MKKLKYNTKDNILTITTTHYFPIVQLYNPETGKIYEIRLAKD